MNPSPISSANPTHATWTPRRSWCWAAKSDGYGYPPAGRSGMTPGVQPYFIARRMSRSFGGGTKPRCSISIRSRWASTRETSQTAHGAPKMNRTAVKATKSLESMILGFSVGKDVYGAVGGREPHLTRAGADPNRTLRRIVAVDGTPVDRNVSVAGRSVDREIGAGRERNAYRTVAGLQRRIARHAQALGFDPAVAGRALQRRNRDVVEREMAVFRLQCETVAPHVGRFDVTIVAAYVDRSRKIGERYVTVG